MDLDLRCVASFAVLVDEGHYGRSARRLHVTSSALTKRIQRLERQLGVRLVERVEGGGFAITAAGRRFAAEARALLSHAESVRESVRAGDARESLRLGFPAGTERHMQHWSMAAISDEFARRCPGLGLACVPVPFASLTESLTESWVDVLLTGPELLDHSVHCTPLNGTVERIGLVAGRHPLADAGMVDAAEFADLPMLHNPAVPREWMKEFVLADVRAVRAARLLAVDAPDITGVLRAVAGGAAVTTNLALAEAALPPQVRAVRLVGAAPIRFHAAHRRSDRRGTVHALVDALRAVVTGAVTAGAAVKT